MSVSVQSSSFSPTDEYESLLETAKGAALATFTGYVREHSDRGAVQGLHLEHYPGMAENVLTSLGRAAEERFDLLGWRIVHRYGPLAVDDIIVWVGAVAHHRGNVISACEFMMDTLKTDAPFWKRERLEEGDVWVKARVADAERRSRW